ncbi:M24 family metallopeptidase [Bauldia sp.]|uniref:M24 family metallopeptidase n=1 Tax=Bauldia sp. TaxID=2575872 RepID=UPI003BA8CB92
MSSNSLPFDSGKLDRLMEDDGIDVLIASSKHNIQYLLGGYRFFFFDAMDAIGLSRYLPLLVYPKGRPDKAAYLGNAMESGADLWPDTTATQFWGTRDVTERAIAHINSLGSAPAVIGVETGFLPADAYTTLTDAFPASRFEDAVVALERLRAVKTPEEIALLRNASEQVVAAMLSVLGSHGPGAVKRDLVEALRVEETRRGLGFDYCLATVGTSLNRAPSGEIWQDGDIASLDSGGNYRGYIGDLCRMAILGEPDAQLADLLAEIDAIQMAARAPIKSGAPGGDVIAAGQAAHAAAPSRNHTSFVAHGMGLVSHEAPRLMGDGPVPYPGDDADRPLEAGMVLSIETTMQHPERGFIKLEDTVLVTDDGWEGLGDQGRGWNRAG